MRSTKTCPTTGWTGWASRPPCTGTRTAPAPCRRCTSTMGPSCTLTSTRTPPTPTPCLPVWAHRLTTLSREIKTRYTGRFAAAVRGPTGCLAARRVLSRLAWDGHERCTCTVCGVQEKRRTVTVQPGTAEQSWRSNAEGKPRFQLGVGGVLFFYLLNFYSIIRTVLLGSNNYKIEVKSTFAFSDFFCSESCSADYAIFNYILD